MKDTVSQPAPDTTRAAADAILAMVREREYDFPGLLAAVLASVAAELGSTYALVASRPGSWEASLVLDLVRGTVGHGDEGLSTYKLAEAATAPGAPAMLTPEDRRTVLEALDVAAEYKRDRAASCPDCDASPALAVGLRPADLCGTCTWRLAQADGYGALAARLGGAR